MQAIHISHDLLTSWSEAGPHKSADAEGGPHRKHVTRHRRRSSGDIVVRGSQLGLRKSTLWTGRHDGLAGTCKNDDECNPEIGGTLNVEQPVALNFDTHNN